MPTFGYELIDECEYETLDELDKHREPFIKGLVRDEGQTILITGGSKSGKSQLAIQLALMIAAGGEWLGFKTKSPIRKVGENLEIHNCVLYVNLELPFESFQYRYKVAAKILFGGDAANQQYCDNFILSDVDYEDIAYLANDENRIDKLLNFIETEKEKFEWTYEEVDGKDDDGYPVHTQKRVPQTYLFGAGDNAKEMPARITTVIIDPVYKAFGGDENSVKEVGRLLSMLHRLGVNVVLVHHHSKGSQSGKASMDRGSGSGAFARDATAIIDIVELTPKEPPKDDARAFKLEFTTRDYKTPAPLYVWYRFPIFELAKPGELDGARSAQLSNHEKGAVAMESKKESKMDEFEHVFDEMDKGDGVKVAAIAKKLDVVDRTILRYMRDINKRHGEKIFSQRKGIITKK